VFPGALNPPQTHNFSNSGYLTEKEHCLVRIFPCALQASFMSYDPARGAKPPDPHFHPWGLSLSLSPSIIWLLGLLCWAEEPQRVGKEQGTSVLAFKQLFLSIGPCRAFAYNQRSTYSTFPATGTTAHYPPRLTSLPFAVPTERKAAKMVSPETGDWILIDLIDLIEPTRLIGGESYALDCWARFAFSCRFRRTAGWGLN